MSSPSPVPAPAQLRADVADPVLVVDAGTVGYLEAWELQRELVAGRRTGEVGDCLVLLQHPPVYTLGRRTDRANLLWDADECRTRGIDVVEVDRGGDVTYHGPGQLVGYPIVRLASMRSVVGHVRALEEVLIRALRRFGVDARRVDEYTGVWVDDAKVAAIGVRVASAGITSHGFALNVTTDLDDYAGIVPCGIADRDVCSLESLGVHTDIEAVAHVVIETFGEVFGASLEPAALDDLRRTPDGHGHPVAPRRRPRPKVRV